MLLYYLRYFSCWPMTVMSQSVDTQHKDRYSPGTNYEQDTPDNISLYQIVPQDRVTY